jgi:hypothetical protein
MSLRREHPARYQTLDAKGCVSGESGGSPLNATGSKLRAGARRTHRDARYHRDAPTADAILPTSRNAGPTNQPDCYGAAVSLVLSPSSRR